MSKRNKQIRGNITITELVVLRIFGFYKGVLYGTKIVNLSHGLIERRGVYMILGRMTRDGLLVREKGKRYMDEVGRHCIIYRLSKKGESCLQAWESWPSMALAIEKEKREDKKLALAKQLEILAAVLVDH